jgi:transposase-like protein
MSQKYGANAIGLARVLNLAHSTTWNVLHKFRRAMVRAEREQLGPVAEVDESFLGSSEKGKPGRGAKDKAQLALAVELSADKKRIGRIRLNLIPNAKSEILIPFIKNNVVPEAKVITDGWRAYLPLTKEGFSHEIKVMKSEEDLLPHVHLVFALLKRWLAGTYQGGFQRRHLEYYLDEYVFRFNSRKSRSRGKLFRRLIEQAVITPPITRKEMKPVILEPPN